jgi:penicillin-binding protein-related factor A (putative recombinase)
VENGFFGLEHRGKFMEMVKESKVKQEIKKILSDNGIFYFMPFAGVFGRSGMADFICCYKGYFVAIEAKSTVGTQRGLQKLAEQQIKKSNGVYIIVNDKNCKDVIKLMGEKIKWAQFGQDTN